MKFLEKVIAYQCFYLELVIGADIQRGDLTIGKKGCDYNCITYAFAETHWIVNLKLLISFS